MLGSFSDWDTNLNKMLSRSWKKKLNRKTQLPMMLLMTSVSSWMSPREGLLLSCRWPSWGRGDMQGVMSEWRKPTQREHLHQHQSVTKNTQYRLSVTSAKEFLSYGSCFNPCPYICLFCLSAGLGKHYKANFLTRLSERTDFGPRKNPIHFCADLDKRGGSSIFFFYFL